MTIREIIEAKAREAADKYPQLRNEFFREFLYDKIRETIIAILTDPEIGYKEALDIVVNVCDSELTHEQFHTAEAKLKELEELSK